MADSSFSSDDGTAPMIMCIETCDDDLVKTPGAQLTPSESSIWIPKKNHDASLTPATMSSASSYSSCGSPYVGNSTVRLFSMSSSLMDEQRSALPSPSSLQQPQTQTLWMPLPSPSRPRLDPRYAARLPSSIDSTAGSVAQPSPISGSTRSSGGASSSTTEAELMPPPSVSRNTSIFRPTPIVATPFNDDPGQKYTKYLNTSEQSVVSPASQWFSASTRSTSSASESIGSSSTIHTSCSQLRSSSRSSVDIGVSDRFIANRATSNFNFNLWEGISQRSNSLASNNIPNGRDGDERINPNTSSNDASLSTESNVTGNSSSLNTVTGSARGLLSTLLRSELLGENDYPMMSSSATFGSNRPPNSTSMPLQEGSNFFRYCSPRQAYQDNLFEDAMGPTAIVNSFSLTPVGSAASQRLMASPPKRKRRISKVPFKVLDAPALQDDFYLNLVDWSSQNVLAVGLGSCVYLWSACTSKVTKLCDLASSQDIVTSVSWAQRGTHLAVGTNRGEVQLWDTIKCKKVRSMAGHTARVGTLAWTGPILASGSRDRFIYLRDVRVQTPFTDKLTNHKQEVCGLKWSYEEPSFLASGGNDNNLHVIDSRHPLEPLHKFAEHTAAVKAITWSPHQHGLLASGGGTADRCIRFWNTLSGCSLNKIDTGSQVCNLAWSQNCNEIVSTHGYSLNQIVVWRYPSMSKVTTLTGHTYRVLYLAMSPDGSTIVTGAGDETLRFWQVFPGPRSDGKDSSGGLLFPNTLGSVIR